jgi:hypothetical protein
MQIAGPNKIIKSVKFPKKEKRSGIYLRSLRTKMQIACPNKDNPVLKRIVNFLNKSYNIKIPWEARAPIFRCRISV